MMANTKLFVSLPQTGRVDPHYSKVCGHQGSVLDIKWSPFRDNILASCSEDCTVSNTQYTLCLHLHACRKYMMGIKVI